MSSLVPVSLHLSKAQVRKAAQDRPIQISAANLHKGTHTIHVHPENHKKIQKAKKANKDVAYIFHIMKWKDQGYLIGSKMHGTQSKVK